MPTDPAAGYRGSSLLPHPHLVAKWSPMDRPGTDALICGPDGTAQIAQHALQMMGRAIGQDILLAACVDSPGLPLCSPPITTINLRPQPCGLPRDRSAAASHPGQILKTDGDRLAGDPLPLRGCPRHLRHRPSRRRCRDPTKCTALRTGHRFKRDGRLTMSSGDFVPASSSSAPPPGSLRRRSPG
ncbi:substrate-binding domain-containing protein [Streptomyces sp. NBC_01591]|uniref:substrate-binding domain-containing protein n=1 Tax=Streptomyces sp. NBC_01591 TaxID=2975888 RepID=UPI003FA3D5A8